MSEAVGRRLKALRKSREFDKKRHFAEHMGWPEDRYDKWETGAALIPPDEALKLKKKYGITADWLYYGEEITLSGTLQAELRRAALAA
jgi:hypothetical protein